MGFPGLGGGQGWSAATLPLSSRATAPSLYLRSQNNTHGALGPLGQAHPLHHTGRGELMSITSAGNKQAFLVWSLLVHVEIEQETLCLKSLFCLYYYAFIIYSCNLLRALENAQSVF